MTTATATMAAAIMRNVQILFQLAMLGSSVCSWIKKLAVYGEDSMQLLGWP